MEHDATLADYFCPRCGRYQQSVEDVGKYKMSTCESTDETSRMIRVLSTRQEAARRVAAMAALFIGNRICQT